MNPIKTFCRDESRANIEKNRLLELSNHSAAIAGNQKLAAHNKEEFFCDPHDDIRVV